MTKIIGLTGGIGSGKTTIGNYFHSLGVPVYIADDAGRQVTAFPEVVSQIKKVFGETIFENGKLSRNQLAAIVFNNPEKLQQLNNIIHPAVQRHFREWLQQHQDAPFVVKETAILFESGSYADCHYIITVTAPIETRIQSVMQRDGGDRENVLERIKNQWTDEERILKSDYTIENSDLTKAKNQTVKILKKLTNLQN